MAYGLPPGLGSHVHWDRRLDARLAGALMGIQAIKGVEVGDGFELAAHPAGRWRTTRSCPRPTAGGAPPSGRAGGTEGGMSTGEVLRVRAAMKPIATVPARPAHRGRRDRGGGHRHHQRSDVCAVPAAGVVAEAMVALVLADAVLEKFGGDSRRGDAAQRRGLPREPDGADRRVRARLAGAAVSPVSSWSARRGRARPPSAGWSPSGWAWRSATPTSDVEAAAGKRSPTSSSTTARRISARWSGRRSSEALAEHDGVLALGGGAVLDAGDPALLQGTAVVFLEVALADAARRVGLDRDRPLLLGNPRGTLLKLHGRAAPALRGGRRPDRRAPTGDARRGRGRDRRSLDAVTNRELQADSGDRRASVRGDAPYDVVVGHGLLGELPACSVPKAARVAVVHPRALRATAEAVRDDLVGTPATRR